MEILLLDVLRLGRLLRLLIILRLRLLIVRLGRLLIIWLRLLTILLVVVITHNIIFFIVYLCTFRINSSTSGTPP